jgi:hypothetical protein
MQFLCWYVLYSGKGHVMCVAYLPEFSMDTRMDHFPAYCLYNILFNVPEDCF